MGGAKGSALEWALALLRAPGERYLLRQRPLPQEGMEQLLGIAAGASPEALAEQAGRFGESEAQVLEAARFYAREVLFHPQADAYRILGVDPCASADTIKVHYRLLQLWLHPDRTRSEDDVVFAARVNSAWNRLRSPERRHAYDEALRAERPPEIFDSSGALRSVRTWVPAAEPLEPPSPWRRRWPALALLALCGILALLALRDVDRADGVWEVGSGASPDSGRRGDSESIASLFPGAGEASGSINQPLARANPTAAMPAQPPERALRGAGISMPPLAVAATPAVSDRGVAREGGRETGGDLDAVAAQPTVREVRSAPPAAIEHPPAAAPHRVDAVASRAPMAADARPQPSPVSQPEFARVQSARLTGAQLLDYLGRPRKAAPPIWSSPAVEMDAARLRQQLHMDGRVRLAEPHWRIGVDEAVLESAALVTGGAARGGQVTARLRWREGYWLVTGIEMEPIR